MRVLVNSIVSVDLRAVSVRENRRGSRNITYCISLVSWGSRPKFIGIVCDDERKSGGLGPP